MHETSARITISEMLTPEMIERIGVDETRDIETCFVRICAELRDQSDRNARITKERDFLNLGVLELSQQLKQAREDREALWKKVWRENVQHP